LRARTYISIDVEVGLDSGRSAEEQFVIDDVRPRRLALNVNAVRAACHYVALFDENRSLGQTLEHDAS
jgi:hypothetical protein